MADIGDLMKRAFAGGGEQGDVSPGTDAELPAHAGGGRPGSPSPRTHLWNMPRRPKCPDRTSRPAMQGQAASTLLTAPEAERMVEGLQQFGPEQVGSVKWMQQHDWVEKLNLQAHHNARSHQVRPQRRPRPPPAPCPTPWRGPRAHYRSRRSAAGRVCDGVPLEPRQDGRSHPRASGHRGLEGEAPPAPQAAPGE